MSVEQFSEFLKRSEREKWERLHETGEKERTKLENELEEIKRQRSDLQTAYGQAQSTIRDLYEKLLRVGNDIGGEQPKEARRALVKGDFSKADVLLAEIEGRADIEVKRAAEAAFQRGEIAALQKQPRRPAGGHGPVLCGGGAALPASSVDFPGQIGG